VTEELPHEEEIHNQKNQRKKNTYSCHSSETSGAFIRVGQDWDGREVQRLCQLFRRRDARVKKEIREKNHS